MGWNKYNFFNLIMNKYLNIVEGEYSSHSETPQNQCSADSLSEAAHTICNEAMSYFNAGCDGSLAGYYATRRVSRKSSDVDVQSSDVDVQMSDFYAQLSDADAQLSSSTSQHYVKMITHIANRGVRYTKAYLKDDIPRHNREADYYRLKWMNTKNRVETYYLAYAEQTRKLGEAQQRNKDLLKKLNALKFENTQLRAIRDAANGVTTSGVRIEAIRDMFHGNTNIYITNNITVCSGATNIMNANIK